MFSQGESTISGEALSVIFIFSSPGQSPGRAIVLPSVSSLASALANVKVLR